MPLYATHARGYYATRDRVSGKITAESDTFTCGHCNGVVDVAPRQHPADIGGLCKICWALTCPRCTARGGCTPFEVRLARAEAREALQRSVGV